VELTEICRNKLQDSTKCHTQFRIFLQKTVVPNNCVPQVAGNTRSFTIMQAPNS